MNAPGTPDAACFACDREQTSARESHDGAGCGPANWDLKPGWRIPSPQDILTTSWFNPTYPC